MSAVDESFHPKLGKTAFAADLTVDGTVRKTASAMASGYYTIESSVDAFAIQVNADVWGAALPSAAQLRAQGTKLPANVEVDFRVDMLPALGADANDSATVGDGYIIIVKDAGASDGTARIVACSSAVTSVLV